MADRAERFCGGQRCCWRRGGISGAGCVLGKGGCLGEQIFRSLLFSRIVPCVKDIGLWGDKVQKCYAEMGVLDMAGLNLDELMKADEDQAEKIDQEKREMAARAAEVEATIAVGASA